jgi:hypothetical protein
MKAYVMTADGMTVIEGAGWLEMCADEVVLIRGDDPKHHPLAAVKLSERLWVAIGDEPPARLLQVTANLEQTPAPRVVARDEGRPETLPSTAGEGGWPSEPPPDVDSED